MDAVLIESTHPEELAEFYRDGLSLPAPQYFNPDHLGIDLPNIYLGFDRVSEERQANRPRTSIWFKVQDVEETYERLVSLGGRSRSSPDREESPGEILASVFDPDGNVIGLIGRPDSPEQPQPGICIGFNRTAG
jgi:predicted enzyme related to lactoylglutathione lyase